MFIRCFTVLLAVIAITGCDETVRPVPPTPTPPRPGPPLVPPPSAEERLQEAQRREQRKQEEAKRIQEELAKTRGVSAPPPTKSIAPFAPTSAAVDLWPLVDTSDIPREVEREQEFLTQALQTFGETKTEKERVPLLRRALQVALRDDVDSLDWIRRVDHLLEDEAGQTWTDHFDPDRDVADNEQPYTSYAALVKQALWVLVGRRQHSTSIRRFDNVLGDAENLFADKPEELQFFTLPQIEIVSFTGVEFGGQVQYGLQVADRSNHDSDRRKYEDKFSDARRAAWAALQIDFIVVYQGEKSLDILEAKQGGLYESTFSRNSSDRAPLELRVYTKPAIPEPLRIPLGRGD